MPSRLNLIGLNQLDLGAQTVAVGKLHHLPGVGDTADQRAFQCAVTKHDQCREDFQLIRGHTHQAELAAPAQKRKPAIQIVRIGDRIQN